MIGLLFIPHMAVFAVEGEEEPLKNARSGILIEVTTGKILFEKNKDEKVAMASLTKMMAQILILEAIEEGKITWEDKVTASSNAKNMGGSQIYLETGEVMSVRDLFKGISMASANDATVAMAEYLAGSEEEFVKMMNEKAKSFKLENTHFVNCTGLDEDNHYSTAYDLAMIARELLKHEQILKFSSVYEDYLRVDTKDKFWLVNTNKLVRFYEGADGLKTGHTDNAKYCLAATALKNGMRLVGVVLGEEDIKVRNSEAMDLLDYGFNHYKVKLLKKKGEAVGSIVIEKSAKKFVEVVPVLDISVLLSKQDEMKNYDMEVVLDEVKLPIKVGTIVGKVKVKDQGKTILTVDLTVSENVEKQGFIEMFWDLIKDMVTG